MAAGRGLYRDSKPNGERNKLQAVPDACPLTSTFSSALSPPARILADHGYLNGGVVQPSPARELGSLFSVFYFIFFFWQGDSSAHISHSQRSLAGFNPYGAELAISEAI